MVCITTWIINETVLFLHQIINLKHLPWMLNTLLKAQLSYEGVL